MIREVGLSRSSLNDIEYVKKIGINWGMRLGFDIDSVSELKVARTGLKKF